MEVQGKVFKYKLDFYYQQALLYLMTFLIYAGIKGSFNEGKFEFLFRDPIVYVIAVFVLMAFIVLFLNRIRDRKLIIADNKLIFKNRFHERIIPFSDISWMYVGRERNVQTSGRFQVVHLKLKHRRRLIRVRIGRYERERELMEEIQSIAQHVPKGKKQRFGRKVKV